jgi:hypothetical protein
MLIVDLGLVSYHAETDLPTILKGAISPQNLTSVVTDLRPDPETLETNPIFEKWS